jgi:hypothetical protein
MRREGASLFGPSQCAVILTERAKLLSKKDRGRLVATYMHLGWAVMEVREAKNREGLIQMLKREAKRTIYVDSRIGDEDLKQRLYHCICLSLRTMEP